MQKMNLNKGKPGFLKEKDGIRVPENFNDLHSKEIEALFNGEDLSAPKAMRYEVHADNNIQEKRK